MDLDLAQLRRSWISHYNGRAYLRWSKSKYRALVGRCSLEEALRSLFKQEVPLNPLAVNGLIIHKGGEEFWTERGPREEKKKWNTKAEFVHTLAGIWTRTYKKENQNRRGPEDPAWVFKDQLEITYGEKRPRRILVKNLESEYKFGFWRIYKCAWVFAHRFWDQPKPPQEVPFDFYWGDLNIVGRLDIAPPILIDRRWIIMETKSGSIPAPHDPEGTFEIVGWGQAVAADPELADQLGVPDHVVDELRENPLRALDYCAIQYLPLWGKDPYDSRPQVRTLAHWEELVRILRFWQPAIMEALATGRFPLNRNHCKKCDVSAICDRKFEQYIQTFSETRSLFLDIPVPLVARRPAPRRRKPGASGIIQDLNLTRGERKSRKHLKDNRKRKYRPRDDFRLEGPKGGA